MLLGYKKVVPILTDFSFQNMCISKYFKRSSRTISVGRKEIWCRP